MNSWQRRVLAIAAVVLLLMLLFPPYVVKWPGGAEFNAGFGFIFWPPDWEGRGSRHSVVHAGQLAIQVALVALIGAIGLALARHLPDPQPRTSGMPLLAALRASWRKGKLWRYVLLALVVATWAGEAVNASRPGRALVEILSAAAFIYLIAFSWGAIKSWRGWYVWRSLEILLFALLILGPVLFAPMHKPKYLTDDEVFSRGASGGEPWKDKATNH